ncbi:MULTISPECIES: hypothetical protein [unclassified Streptomyces]|uniref:hypothetical protein n=1 Tax=unclassified Streptomyces TaxID=2593676 RepID=UPI002E29050F|nr:MULTISPECIES: hypothetical protein [unclassified Streptomyces]
MPEQQTQPAQHIVVTIDPDTTIVGRPTAPGQPDLQALIDDLLHTGHSPGFPEPATTKPLPPYPTLSDLDAAVRRRDT